MVQTMIKRDLYLKRLEMYVGRDVIKIVTGVRRAGKTTILHQLIAEMKEGGIPEENIIYLNFEGLIYSYFTKPEELREMLVAFLQGTSGHSYIFLDEPQNIKDWAKVCAELSNLFDCEIFVCASNAKLFYEGYAKDLGYRYVRIEVYPLIFNEFLEFAAGEEAYAAYSKEQLFELYLRRGAFPAVYSMTEEAAVNYLKDTYSAIILKDVVQCNKLRDISHIDKIMSYILGHIGETFSPKSIKDYVKEQGVTISVDTVYSFLDALLGAGLIYRVPRFDIKNNKELETQEKYYICDLAMSSAVMGDACVSGKARLESVLFMELLTRGFKVFVGKQGRSQIDFMAVKSEDRTYLNCCEYLTDNEIIRREFNPLVKIKDNYFKMVLTMDSETKVNKGGIINYPLIHFLVQS